MSKLQTIMVVEDDPDIRDILELSLSGVCGFAVQLYGDAHSALVALEGVAPDMILLDLMLPDLSGLDALPLIRAQKAGKDSVIVLLTAMARSEVRDDYMRRGIQEVLFKPFDPMTLPAVLADIWLATHARD
jgi:DNA-binding response OmpR family regulator